MIKGAFTMGHRYRGILVSEVDICIVIPSLSRPHLPGVCPLFFYSLISRPSVLSYARRWRILSFRRGPCQRLAIANACLAGARETRRARQVDCGLVLSLCGDSILTGRPADNHGGKF